MSGHYSAEAHLAYMNLSKLPPDEILYAVSAVLENVSVESLQVIAKQTTEILFYQLRMEYRTARDYAGALSLALRDPVRPAYRAKIIECLLDSGLHAGTVYEGELKAEWNRLCEDPAVVEYLKVMRAR